MGITSLLNPRSIGNRRCVREVGTWLQRVQGVGICRVAVGSTYQPESCRIFGRQTFASLDQISGTVDAVFIAVKAEDVLDVAKAAARKGAGALGILSSGIRRGGRRYCGSAQLAATCAARRHCCLRSELSRSDNFSG